ncbi:MAG: hypothetical protein ACP5IL_17420 [Syntrophobacteraceae bacterium]
MTIAPTPPLSGSRPLPCEDRRVVAIDPAGNLGKKATLTVGLDYARSEAATSLDADLQEPWKPISAGVINRKWTFAAKAGRQRV